MRSLKSQALGARSVPAPGWPSGEFAYTAATMRNLPRQWILWMATMAVLLGSLAPGISKMLSGLRQQPLAWVEVCTAQGAQWVAINAVGAEAAKQKQLAHGEGHCPFCLLQAHGMAPPPALPGLPVAMTGADAQPFLFLHAPHPLHAWSSAQARAPPVLA